MNPKHVCSLELAKELKAAGVKQKSMFYWCSTSGNVIFPTGEVRPTYELLDNKFAAFTAGEIGMILPPRVNSYKFHNSDGKDEFICYLRADSGIAMANKLPPGFTVYDENEANSRAKELLYLIRHKLITL